MLYSIILLGPGQVVEEIAILKKFSNPHIIRFINAFETPSEVGGYIL